MAMSLDGKITTYRRERMTLGTRNDRKQMDELRAESDAVIIGASTLRLDGYPILVRTPAIRRRAETNRSPAHPLNVVLSTSLNLPTNRPFFQHPDTERIVFTTREAPASRVRRISKFAEVVVLPRRTLSPSAVLEKLAERGVKTVVLEGGGEVHFAFAREGVIDEVYVTLTPRLLGGAGAPTILDGRGFLAADHLQLRLVSVKQIGSELFLRYRVRH